MPNIVMAAPCFSGGKLSSKIALAARLEPAAGQALDHPEQDDLLQAGGHAAQPRGEGEDGDREQEVVAAAEVGREPAA